MKVLIVYDSAYGNTRKVAKTLADAIMYPNDAELVLVTNALPSATEQADVLVIGSPTQGGRPTKDIQNYLDSVSEDALDGKAFMAFDTRFAIEKQGFGLRLLMRIIGFAAPKIATRLRSRGGKQLADPEGFIVNDKDGPIAAGELDRAKDWIINALEAQTT